MSNMESEVPEDREAFIARVGEIIRASRAIALGAVDENEFLTVCSLGLEPSRVSDALRRMADTLDILTASESDLN